MNKLSDVNSVVKQFQEHTQTNEIPNFDFQLVRFGPKKAYWYYSYSYDSWNEIILGSWNGDFEEKRFNTSNKPDQDISEIRAKVKNLIDEQNKIHREKAALHARKLIPTLSTGHHEYLEKKRVKPYGTFIDSTFLIIPVMNNNELVGLQRISRNGEKTFYEGTMMSASYHALSPFKDASIIHLSEGYATAATIQEAFPGTPSVMAFNANNLPKVAKYLRDQNPTSEIVIFADKDSINKLGYRTGEHYAQIACAQVSNCRYVLPDCGIIEKCDFNDVGVEATRRQFSNNVEIKTTSFKQKSYMPPQGLMADVIDSIIATSVRENYALALGGAISLLSTFASNRFRFNGTWANTFVLCLAETGAGKSFHQNFIREILLRFDTNLLGHGSYASSPAITMNCKSQRERLDIIDEVSTLFNAMSSGGSYQKDMVEELSKIWSSSGQLYKAAASKTKEDTASAYNICININGSSTISGVKSAINKEMVTKGLIPRFLIFIEEGYSDVKMQEEPSNEVFNRMMTGFEKISKINKKKIDGVDILLGPKYDPTNVFPTDEKAIKFYKEQIYLHYNNKIKDQETDEAKQIMTRACENIAKLAVVHFVSRMAYDDSIKHVDIQDLFWAKNVYDSCSHNSSMFISESAVDSDYERDLKQIENFIAKSSEGTTKAKIKNRFIRIDEQKIEKILSHLKNSNKIILKEIESKNKNKAISQRYFLIDDSGDCE